MKKNKKIIMVGALVLAIGATSATGFAASAYKTPAEAVAGLTGKTVEDVIAERQETNQTYGKIAADAGKLDEFKNEKLEIKKDNINNQVEEGRITQEKADLIIKSIEENQANCDGTGSGMIGRKEGARFGSNGLGQGLGRDGEAGQGKGQGLKQGQGRSQRKGGMRI